MTKLEKSMARIPAKVQAKARALLARVAAGETVAALGGRRMRHDRTAVSVPIGRSWRLVLDDSGEQLDPVAVLSHENYSRGVKAGKR